MKMGGSWWDRPLSPALSPDAGARGLKYMMNIDRFEQCCAVLLILCIGRADI